MKVQHGRTGCRGSPTLTSFFFALSVAQPNWCDTQCISLIGQLYEILLINLTLTEILPQTCTNSSPSHLISLPYLISNEIQDQSLDKDHCQNGKSHHPHGRLWPRSHRFDSPRPSPTIPPASLTSKFKTQRPQSHTQHSKQQASMSPSQQKMARPQNATARCSEAPLVSSSYGSPSTPSLPLPFNLISSPNLGQ